MSEPQQPTPKPAFAPPVSERYPVYGDELSAPEVTEQATPARRFATYNAATEHSSRARVAVIAGIIAFFVTLVLIIVVTLSIAGDRDTVEWDQPEPGFGSVE